MEMWRQGDVLVKRVKRVPEGAKKKEGRVVMEGEMTGHAHRLTAGELYEKDGQLYFGVPERADLVHEEHGTITFDEGCYQVIRQREYDPFARAQAYVAD